MPSDPAAADRDHVLIVEDSLTQAVQLRFVLEYNAAKSLTFDLGGGGVVYGHPGETEAYGTFVLLGMTATF